MEKKGKKNLILLMLIFTISTCFSCKRRDVSNQNLNGIPILSLKAIEESIIDSTFLEGTEIIFLDDTSTESLIGDIDRITQIAFDDNKYFILDDKQQQILIFTDKGKHISTINRKGQGPQEYIEIWKFTLDTVQKQILLMCTAPIKLMYFDYSGGFIKEEPFHNFHSDIACDNYYFYCVNVDKRISNPEGYEFEIVNCSDKKTTKHLPILDNKNFYANHGVGLTEGRNQIHFTRRYDYVIYKLENGEVLPEYVIDFNKYSMPDKMYLKDDEEFRALQAEKDDFVYHMTNLVSTDNQMLFFTIIAYFIYNKKENSLTGYKNIVNSYSEGRLPLNNYIPIMKTDKIVFLVEPMFLYSTLHDHKDFAPKFEDKSLRMDSNPVMFVYSLK